MSHYNVPGFSIALLDPYEITWAAGYGVQEAGTERPITPDTIFQAASISKTVAAMIALALV